MEVTTALITELRKRTGIGMMECKKALVEANGDIEASIEVLRKKGLAKAASKADREALEGAIKIEIEGNKAYVISVSCETDFLANSPRYQEMLQAVLEYLKAGKTKEETKEMIDRDFSLEMGENLQIGTYEVHEGDSFGAYVHSNNKLAALIIAKPDIDTNKLKQVAMHVTASNPDFLAVENISIDVIEKEKSIQLEIMKNDPKMAGKPDEVLLKIIEGKMSKFASEIALLEQQFVVDPNQKIKDFIGKDSIKDFYRYNI